MHGLFLCFYSSVLIASFSRLARRGGIKRISGTIYDEARQAMVDRLKTVSLNFDRADMVWTNSCC